ncbi:hypothetical protein [Ferrimonas sp.]|uniref:hypothetical protein n=1 Tax=Ferrimonas sp. TaxID=2080861 RepID=UPI003A8EA380
MKPDCRTAMAQLIEQVRDAFPFGVPEAEICGDTCVGCPKKLLELVDTELCDWETRLEHGETPKLGDISRLAKLCKNVYRGLKKNRLVM